VTARELIAELEKMPADLEVIVSVYDGNSVRKVEIFDIPLSGCDQKILIS